jgi:hypothetical protein
MLHADGRVQARRLAAIAAGVLAGVLSACVATHPPAPASAPAAAPERAVANSLAAQYPGDRGMSADPASVFYEDLSADSLDALLARYTEVRNSAGIQLVADQPAGSAARFAVQLTAGGDHAATHLYKSFPAGYDELYLRYYVRYAGAGPWHHSGVWFGGYDPPLPYPYPRAGQRPAGDDLFSIALEPIGAGSDAPMDRYAYWMGMRSWKAAPSGTRGDYFGNTLLHRSQLRVRTDSWDCYEIHLKLNPTRPQAPVRCSRSGRMTRSCAASTITGPGATCCGTSSVHGTPMTRRARPTDPRGQTCGPPRAALAEHRGPQDQLPVAAEFQRRGCCLIAAPR